MANDFQSSYKPLPVDRDYRRQENPSFSPRLSRRERLLFWGSLRSWYPYGGYGRRVSLKISPPILLEIPSERFYIRRLLIPGLIFFLIPLLLFLVYPDIGRRLYYGFIFSASRIRPLSPALFFREMYVLILSGAAIILIQTIFALIFLRKKRIPGGAIRIPWGEASIVGGLLGLGVFGILRGFQSYPGDHLFFPAPALRAAILCWLLISGTILFPVLSRKYPWADSNGRHPV
jgi:hypothetical protein